MSITLEFFSGLIDSSGVRVGYNVNGLLFIPYNGGGIIMEDSAGAKWLLQINTDGSLAVSQVTL